MEGPDEIGHGKAGRLLMFGTRDRDAFIRRMRARGAAISHDGGRMYAVLYGRRHLTFSDRPEDYGRVWMTSFDAAGNQRSIRWVDGNIEDWFAAFDEDM